MQLNKNQTLLVLSILIHFLFFTNNYYLLLLGNVQKAEVKQTSGFTNKYKSEAYYFYDNITYSLKTEGKLTEDIQIIHSKTNPKNAYIFTFKYFILEKLIAFFIVFFALVFLTNFYIKKNNFVTIHFKPFSIKLAPKKWSLKIENQLETLIQETTNPKVKPYLTHFFLSKGLHLDKTSAIVLHTLIFNKIFLVSYRNVQINKQDKTGQSRAFIELNSEISLENLDRIEQEFFSLLEPNKAYRTHEVRILIQKKYGEKFELLAKSLEQEISTEIKTAFEKTKSKINFIQSHFTNLTQSNTIEKLLSLLVDLHQNILLFEKKERKIIQDSIKNNFDNPLLKNQNEFKDFCLDTYFLNPVPFLSTTNA